MVCSCETDNCNNEATHMAGIESDFVCKECYDKYYCICPSCKESVHNYDIIDCSNCKNKHCWDCIFESNPDATFNDNYDLISCNICIT